MVGPILVLVLTATVARVHAAPVAIRCDDLATDDLSIDGLLDEWQTKVLTRFGAAPDGSVAVRCAWDGTALAIALDLADDKIIRVKGKGDNDRVTVSITTGDGKPVSVSVYPGNAIEKVKYAAPKRVELAESLQPKGFSVEARIPITAIPGFSSSTPALATTITFHDADQAAGGDSHDLTLALQIELGDRKDLLDDFLQSVKLRKQDLRVDQLAELDPDRKGKERIVAGGTVIGVLTDQFAYATLPAATTKDVLRVELLALGPKGQQVVAATVRQAGNGGSRDLLLLFTVWSGQLQGMRVIEIRKQLGANRLESAWKVVKGRGGKPELLVTPRPAVGFTAETWNEEPAADADPIITPWDPTTGGAAYQLAGADVTKRALPAPRGRR